MSLSPIPNPPFPIESTGWEPFQAHYEELLTSPLDDENVRDWLRQWSDLNRLVEEAGAVAYINSSLDTADQEAERAFLNYVENVAPNYSRADQALKQRLLAVTADNDALGPDMAIAVRNIRNQADLFREANIPLLTELAKLGNEYDKITGGLTADWEGEERNLNQLNALLRERDRATRERAWRLMMGLWATKRAELNDVYSRMLALRQQVAANAGLPNFRDYAFRAYNRFDYTPDDCFRFHDAIEATVVPAATRVYERRRAQLGLDSLRPWDVLVDPVDAPPLAPYHGQDELIQGSLNIFERVDPGLARQFATMAEENLLDLDTRCLLYTSDAADE